MICRTCAREGVPMDSREPQLCAACAMSKRLRPLGAFPAILPDETVDAINRIQVHEGTSGRHRRLRCECGADYWVRFNQRRLPERCEDCRRARKLASNRASKARREAA